MGERIPESGASTGKTDWCWNWGINDNKKKRKEGEKERKELGLHLSECKEGEENGSCDTPQRIGMRKGKLTRKKGILQENEIK